MRLLLAEMNVDQVDGTPRAGVIVSGLSWLVLDLTLSSSL